MNAHNHIPTTRIEAFSDGVIAIIITVMVFDLKLIDLPSAQTVWIELLKLAPKFLSYTISFFTVAILWMNHHQLYHQIKHSDRQLLWYSLHLLFWMSFIPFCTNFIGANPLLWQASFFYGLVFFMSALSFTWLRNYVIKADVLHDTINKQAHIRIRNKNRIALSIYLAAAFVSLVSVYISFLLFLVVPTMYIIPEKITHLTPPEK